jgi:hypothetical protein
MQAISCIDPHTATQVTEEYLISLSVVYCPLYTAKMVKHIASQMRYCWTYARHSIRDKRCKMLEAGFRLVLHMAARVLIIKVDYREHNKMQQNSGLRTCGF